MNAKCETCDFFKPGSHQHEDPQCRRYPPTTQSREWAAFPNVKPDWWCGEWRNSDELVTAAERRSAIRGGLGT